MGIERITEILELTKDKTTQSLSVLSTDHKYIHAGLAYTAIIQTGSINSAYDICFTTPKAETAYIHWRPIGLTTSANYVSAVLYEGDTFSGGSSVTAINRNRITKNDPVYTSYITDMVSNATCTPAGTVLWAAGFGSTGAAFARSGGATAAEEEIVLAPETKYCLTLTPGGATEVITMLYWYEEIEGYTSGR